MIGVDAKLLQDIINANAVPEPVPKEEIFKYMRFFLKIPNIK